MGYLALRGTGNEELSGGGGVDLPLRGADDGKTGEGEGCRIESWEYGAWDRGTGHKNGKWGK